MNVLLQYIRPIVVFFFSFSGVLAVILGAVANPEGAVNTFLIKIIDLIAPVFPSTPDNLKIFYILDSVSNQMPAIGRYIVYDIAQTIGSIVAIVIVIKIYKLIPFKMT